MPRWFLSRAGSDPRETRKSLIATAFGRDLLFFLFFILSFIHSFIHSSVHPSIHPFVADTSDSRTA